MFPCQQHDETLDHLFFHCPLFARLRSVYWPSRWQSQQGSLTNLLFHLPLNSTQQLRLIVMVWIIWNARNFKLFRGVPTDFLALHNRCLRLNRELELKNPSLNSIPKILFQCAWSPPPVDFTRLNTDGSALGNPGHAGIGCIFRNHCGEFIQAASGYIGYTDNNVAEMVALRTGLKLALQRGMSKLLIQTDSHYLFACLCRK